MAVAGRTGGVASVAGRLLCGRGTRPVCAILLALLFGACATGGGGASRGASRLDILTGYTLALTKRDFRTAAGLLAPAERALLTDAGGDVRPEYRDRLRAMRLTTLLNHPAIRIEAGRIAGIHGLLPVLDQAEDVPFLALADSGAAPAASGPEPAPARDVEREALRKAASALFTSVRERRWAEAMRLVDRGEREVFLRPDGKVKEDARLRLQAIDTSAWEALAMEDGKLSGVVLIIPARVPAASGRRVP